MLLGVQVSTEDGLLGAIKQATRLGCNTIQIFARNPRQRREEKELDLSRAKIFKKEIKRVGIKPLFIHMPYPVNLASPSDRLYYDSIKAYIEDIKEADGLGAEFLVSHLGSHKGQGEDFGIERLSQALNIILDKTYDTKVNILLENTAGSGFWLGYRFKHHSAILKKINQKRRVGICLDTCHAYVAGYDLSKEEGINAMLREIDEEVGLEKLKLIHLNDAKDECGSHRDRHADIGKGKIGRESMKAIVNHPRLKDLPFILETPKKDERDDMRNLATVRELRDETG
ncbi:MAG: deoxyribonuclease IV [Candidatus Omnitrophica bacterium]|nr:deoxyribonuclease IV [Candidatus Omnitrophota bacterium]